jgi:serine/threonine-protein kinase RsbW
MKQAMDYIEMNIPAKPEYVGVIRLTLAGITNRMGYSNGEVEDIKIAVSEACTNAVRHAYHEDEAGKMVVGFAIYQDKLEVIVADQGKNFNAAKTKQMGPYTQSTRVEQLAEGGLGLYLIRTLMDEMHIAHHDGVTVSMIKYLSEGWENHDRSISTNAVH